jgi:hypothetical protein
MSLPPHREKNAKVEGRDPPEPTKETMAAFSTLMKRLLKVPISEVQEQQVIWEKDQKSQTASSNQLTPKKKNTSPKTLIDASAETTSKARLPRGA